MYRPLGALEEFRNELDTSISSFPDTGSPLIVLGDFDLPTPDFNSFPSTSFYSFSSFDLTLSQSPPTHKAGNMLDIIFTRGCSLTNLTATHLHVSNQYVVYFSLISPPTLPTQLLPRWSCASAIFTLPLPGLSPLLSYPLSFLLNPSLFLSFDYLFDPILLPFRIN